MSPLTYLDYPLDVAKALEAAAEAKENVKAYTDSRFPDLVMDYWKISKFSNDFINQIMKDFDVKGKPRFYWLDANANIPVHVDNGTTCSINFVLTEDAAPVTFDGEDYYYKQALLNTSIPHGVRNGSSERILLKISIFDAPYKELAQRIKFKKDDKCQT